MEDTAKKEKENRSVASRFKPSMVVWPILFGLIGVGYMLWREMHNGIPDEPLELNEYWWVFGLLVVLFTLLKDFSGMYRLRVMSGAPLTFRQLFRIRMLYEFTSAVTPSAAGGSSLEVIFIHREGIKVSRATSMTILALFMDELLMIVFFPALLAVIPYNDMFTSEGYFQYGYLWAFIIGYAMKFVWVTLLAIGLFFKPSVFVSIIGFVFRLKWLKRFRLRGLRTAIEMRQCAQEIRHESFGYWLRLALSTIGIWGFRFLIANAAIMIFNPLSFDANLMCFARQYILGIVCMIVPTPGGSGFAEVMFDDFLVGYISQKMSTVMIASIWRLFTYYYYLIAGVIILPQWLGRSKLIKKNHESK
ncbi:MAG: flippase-like domain-containing protein [Paludibacteraceae bacterium]|nr:flippase-like domain-containing protein [Paludibacteraceae bacterium]MBQ2189970.1 flippase-like domain-containing protein [Paludibacteraceae bacterium]MBQ2520075.1 flippase-like domain-containing protein [Paludibacteraceae bacterium]MBQ4017986.1 flippase-like domain-containing protein [Paludibacteraceae bacterium]MBQ5379051.1 flippase-like domain-containing protein [Paludibacteraceae bacterium]